MILSNTAIFEALDDRRLVLEPEPQPRLQQPGGEQSPYGTSAVDLTLGPLVQIPQDDFQGIIDLRETGSVARTLSLLSDSRTLDGDGWRLPTQRLVLAQTREFVQLRLPHELGEPASARPCLAARVEGKSSLARFGLRVHFTAPTIHAGWSGRITLEIMCLGRPIMLYPGMPICQLILEEVSGWPTESRSQFHDQTTPAGQP